MNFKFRLQRVLEIRELIEKEKMRLLALAQEKLHNKETELQSLKQQRSHFTGEMGKKSGLTAREIASSHNYLNMLGDEVEEMSQAIVDMRQAVEKKRAELLKASQEKKAMEKLKEKAGAVFFQAQARAEQIFLDEIALNRRKVGRWQ